METSELQPALSTKARFEKASGEEITYVEADYKKAIAACVVGNFLELFDFAIYGFLAVAIGQNFFPASDPLGSLIGSFGAFAAGFIMRPVGAIVLSAIGDRRGRKAVLAFTIVMMAAATGLIGLLPNYQTIGLAAPGLLVLCRMAQGFSTGGEWGGAAVFLVEHSPQGQRGWVSSLQQMGNHLGTIVGSGMVAALTWVLPSDAFQSWGWRIPFLLGALVGPIGLYLRSKVSDTPAFRAALVECRIERTPVRTALAQFGRRMLAAFLITIVGVSANYIFTIYLLNFSIQQLHIAASQALICLLVANLFLTAALPVVGSMSDRVGRKPLMLACCAGYVLLSYPLFSLLNSAPTVLVFLIVQFVFSTLQIFYTGTIAAILAELFPTRVRLTGVSISYGLAATIFGGTAPLFSSLLVKYTGSPISPAFYLIIAGIVSGAAMLWMPDRTNIRLDAEH
jgi:MFS transporter, MHS family, proline/betaine transporter